MLWLCFGEVALGAEIRVLSWNVGKGGDDVATIATRLKAINIGPTYDLIALTEVRESNAAAVVADAVVYQSFFKGIAP